MAFFTDKGRQDYEDLAREHIKRVYDEVRVEKDMLKMAMTQKIAQAQAAANAQAQAAQSQYNNVLGQAAPTAGILNSGGMLGGPGTWGQAQAVPVQAPKRSAHEDLEELATRLGMDASKYAGGNGYDLLTAVLAMIVKKTGIGLPDKEEKSVIDMIVAATEEGA